MSSMKEYNIILLGETGAGKSMFINSVANYLQFDDFDEAVYSEERVTLISSKFEVTDSKEEEHVIEAGENDGNERREVAESCTISCKSYSLILDNAIVRLIDTPGVGDTQGETTDGKHVSNILSFVNNYENLHAIGIVMKASENKMTDRFSYCLKTLLHNLNKTAVANIVFILTHNNDFKIGRVKDVIEKFNKVEVDTDFALKLDKSRVYCFENQSYEYLMATYRGIHFDEDDVDRQKDNWKKSSREMKRLMNYVSGLTPYKVRETMSLNEARQFIRVINPFLPVVFQNINENTNLISTSEKNLKMTDQNLKNMKSDDSLKQKDIKVIPIDKAITFCTSNKCREVIRIGGEEKYHYPKKCCEGCIVINSCRWLCEAMDLSGFCKRCKCSGADHDRRYYKTETIFSDLLTPEAAVRIRTATTTKERLEIEIEDLRQTKAHLLLEKNVLEEAEKKFAKFLLTHELVKPPKQGYFQGNDAFFNVIQKYDREMEEMKCISTEDFYQLKATIINLPINGKHIRNVLEANNRGLERSVGIKETVKKFFKTILTGLMS